MEQIHNTLLALASAYGLWVFYLAVMNLLRAKRDGKLSKPALWLAYPVLAVDVTHTGAQVGLQQITLATIQKHYRPVIMTITTKAGPCLCEK